MDREYLAPDNVTVYETATKPALDQKPLAKVQIKPYRRAGFDYYVYRGRLYDGYVDGNHNPCIFLDRPTFQRV